MGYRIVRVDAELFAQMFTEGYTLPTREGLCLRVTKGLPAGAKFEGARVSTTALLQEVLYLRFSHPAWPDVAPGAEIPEIPVEFTMEPAQAFTATGLSPEDVAQLEQAVAGWRRDERQIVVLPAGAKFAYLASDAPPAPFDRPEAA